MKTQFTVVSAIALPVCLLALTFRARAQEGRHGQASLPGSWQVEVTATEASVCGGPAVPAPPPFTELITFDAGGGYHETNSELNWIAKALFPGLTASASDGFGTWARRENRAFVQFRKLLFDSTGAYIGKADIKEVVDELQHDRLAGKFTIEFKFLDGSPSVCGAGDFEAAPIHPEERP